MKCPECEQMLQIHGELKRGVITDEHPFGRAFVEAICISCGIRAYKYLKDYQVT